MAKFDLKHYARQGVKARVEELRAELAAIFRAFPELRRGRPGATAGRRRVGRPAAAGGRARKKRSHLSAAQREAVSVRMKKYWADRRKVKAAKTAPRTRAASK